MTYILTMVIMLAGPGGNDRPATIVAEYHTQERCETALRTNREALSSGRVILATCTKK